MIFSWQKFLKNDDFHIAFGDACSQEGGIFDYRIILTITSSALQGLRRSTLAIRNPPLCLITHGSDGKIGSNVDHSNACTAPMANAFRNDSYQSLRSGSTRSIRVAARDGFEVAANIGLHAAPFLQQVPISNRFSIEAKQQSWLPSAARLWCHWLRVRPIFDHGGKRNMVGGRKGGT